LTIATHLPIVVVDVQKSTARLVVRVALALVQAVARRLGDQLPARPFQLTGKVRPMKLNHVNLTSIDIPAKRAMFERYFGLRCLASRGSGLAVLEDDDGMVFVLNNFSRKRGDFAYPEDSDVLHIGFIQETREAVDAMHARLVADGLGFPRAARLSRPLDLLL
jgi:hypothetical protein